MAFYRTIQRVIRAVLWNGENVDEVKALLGTSFLEDAGGTIVYVPSPATDGSLVKLTRYLPIGWYIFTVDDIHYEKMRSEDFLMNYEQIKGEKK